MHELGSITTENYSIITKPGRNHRVYVMDEMRLVMTYPQMEYIQGFFGPSSEVQSLNYSDELSSKGYKSLIIYEGDLKNRGLTVDEVCSLFNYLMNSPSLLNLPDLSKDISRRKLNSFLYTIKKEGW